LQSSGFDAPDHASFVIVCHIAAFEAEVSLSFA
jgi:hypothetical protein